MDLRQIWSENQTYLQRTVVLTQRVRDTRARLRSRVNNVQLQCGNVTDDPKPEEGLIIISVWQNMLCLNIMGVVANMVFILTYF